MHWTSSEFTRDLCRELGIPVRYVPKPKPVFHPEVGVTTSHGVSHGVW